MTQTVLDPLYRRHRFPAEVIVHAVWLYLRFPLSLRMVEDLLAARGIIVSHQTGSGGVKTGQWAEQNRARCFNGSVANRTFGHKSMLLCRRLSCEDFVLLGD